MGALGIHLKAWEPFVYSTLQYQCRPVTCTVWNGYLRLGRNLGSLTKDTHANLATVGDGELLGDLNIEPRADCYSSGGIALLIEEKKILLRISVHFCIFSHVRCVDDFFIYISKKKLDT